MANGALKLLALAAVVGGGVYVYRKRKAPCEPGYHRMADGSCMLDSQMPGAYTPGQPPAAPSGWDQMLALYQTIVTGHGTDEQCQRMLAYLDTLEPETPEEQSWLDGVKTTVQASCEYDDPAPALPSWIPADRQAQFNACWQFSPNCDYAGLVASIYPIIENYASAGDLVPPAQVTQARDAMQALRARRETAGVAGAPHVGNCGCAECQAHEDDDEPCCDACAAGVGACSCSRPKRPEEQQPYASGST